MKTIGMDLSLTATGIVTLEDGKIIDQDLIKSKPSGKKPINELQRILDIVCDIMIVDGVELVAIENLSFAARNTTSLTQLAGLSYFVRNRLYEMDVRFVLVAPSSLKKFTTGKGNSKKDEMMLAIYKRWGEEFKDDNLADAYALARVAEGVINSDELIQAQIEVVELLKTQL